MLIQQKKGNINSLKLNNQSIDLLKLEWYETSKRILHKRSEAGKEITLKFLKENQELTEGDIIYQDSESIIVIDVLPCAAIIIHPKTMQEMASVCYEIGNKHLPLFLQEDELLVPFEAPLFRLLLSAGYDVKEGKRKLISPLRSTVTPHGHNGQSLFSKILKLTTSPDE
ncbi:MAG: Urease accessory protein ureE [Chitinophagaceae bacterium]|nr:Urease accessory protein ureE [Chitinophagaceae bacterium]